MTTAPTTTATRAEPVTVRSVQIAWWSRISLAVWAMSVVGYIIVGVIVMNAMEEPDHVKLWWHDLPFVFVGVGVLAALSALAASIMGARARRSGSATLAN
ncbi:MAG: hypothetical protein L0G99_09690 [Propionibacteriales bacterium]|nr:hypothetical protein [Propionibacteriales bacterium]